MATDLRNTFVEIANAIRKKGNTQAKLTLGEMPQAINHLPAGVKNIDDYFDEFNPGSPFQEYHGTTEDLYQILNSGGTIGKWTQLNGFFMYADRITTIPNICTKNATDMISMFAGCRELITIPLLDTLKVINMNNMFSRCSNLQTIPLLDTRHVQDMAYMFDDCINLISVPSLDVHAVTDMRNIFQGCRKLTEINIININADLDISSCVDLQQPALHRIIDNLAPQRVGRKTLTMHSALLDRVTPEYQTKADQKG